MAGCPLWRKLGSVILFFVVVSGIALIPAQGPAKVEEGWFDFKLDEFVQVSSLDPAVKIEDLKFEKDDIFGVRATVNLKNLTDEQAAISFHIALFDADKRLISVGSYNSVAPPVGGFKPREAYHATIQMYAPKQAVEKIKYFQAQAFRRQ
ncbi:MAG: hypothetical protein RDV41_01245 [Planctomycetota bacterium]|nr:hypothetical protein [Planctomycetota bacterium]